MSSLLILLFLLAAAGAAAESSCGEAAPTAETVEVELGATLRGFAGEEPTRLRFEVETPGLVTLEISSGAGAKMTLLGTGYGERLGKDTVRIESSATHLAFAALSPGAFYVELEAAPSADRYKLATSFVPVEARERVLELGSVRARQTALYPVLGAPGTEPFATLLAFYEGGDLRETVVLVRERSRQKAEDHEVDPDPYVKAEDHEVDPDPYVKAEDHEVDPDPYVKAEDHEVDPDPYAKRVRTWTAQVFFPAKGLAKAEDHEVDPDPYTKAEDHEVDPDPYTKAEDHEVDPDPYVKQLSSPKGRRIRFAELGRTPAVARAEWLSGWSAKADPALLNPRFQVLEEENLFEASMLLLDLDSRCVGEETDDHADTFTCATPAALGSRVSAELANGWGDDEDVYRFRIGEARTVGIAVAGEAVSAALFDRAGQRFATAADGLLVRTLAAGEYFVRVSGVPGPYELLLE